MNLSLKSLKVNQKLSEETLCFSADILLDGKKVGECSNRGHGGATMYHFTDRNLQTKAEEYAKSLPNEPKHDLKMDLELYLDLLVEETEKQQTYKRWCKNKVVFRLKSKNYQEGEWTTVKGVYSPELKAQLVKQFGEMSEVLNETLNCTK